MGEGNIAAKIAKGWDALAETYQRRTVISTHDVHYGPMAHGEKRLRLLGNVRGKNVLEIGCGGGQNAIALARWGAKAFGVDPSNKQISFARRLAKECEVDATFKVAPAEDLSAFDDGYFDLALSSHAFGYVGNLGKAYSEAHRVLRPGGLFVLCVGNPFYIVVSYYLTGVKMDGVEEDYLSWPSVERWNWEYDGEPPVEMWGYSRTLSQMFNPLLDIGFTLERLVEQGVLDVPHMSEKEKAEIPYLCGWSDEEFGVARKIPYSFIMKLRKSGARKKRCRAR